MNLRQVNEIGIKVKIIDKTTVDINEVQLSTEEAIQFLKAISIELGQELLTQAETDTTATNYYKQGQEDGQADGEEVGYDIGHKKGYNEGYEVGLKESQKDKTYHCKFCQRELPKEAIERLSDNVTPRLDEKDKVNLIFDLYDYNEKAKGD